MIDSVPDPGDSQADEPSVRGGAAFNAVASQAGW